MTMADKLDPIKKYMKILKTSVYASGGYIFKRDRTEKLPKTIPKHKLA